MSQTGLLEVRELETIEPDLELSTSSGLRTASDANEEDEGYISITPEPQASE